MIKVIKITKADFYRSPRLGSTLKKYTIDTVLVCRAIELSTSFPDPQCGICFHLINKGGEVLKVIFHWAEFSARSYIFLCLKTSWRRVGVKRRRSPSGSRDEIGEL